MNDHHRYECIDPSLGDELWRLDDTATPDQVRARIEDHLVFCAACRLEVSLATHVATGLRDGSLRVAGETSRRRLAWPWWNGVGGALAAAGLAMILILPPGAPESGSTRRGGEEAPAITRPVSNEVVAAGHPELRWNPVTDARTYRVTVRSVDGTVEWQGEATEPRLRLPDDTPLPAGKRYRVAVEPVPAYLGGGSGLRTTFRTGTWLDVVGFRLVAGSAVGRGVGALGLAALLFGAGAAIWQRRAERRLTPG